MSLVGSLEDLGLVDILQIVSLSRKSGRLELRSESGDGHIVLCDGLVQGAAIKGEVEDLRGLLIQEGCVDDESFERALRSASDDSLALDEALIRSCGLETESLSALRRVHVERTVMRMFGWRNGEFSFEIRNDLSLDGDDLMLPVGLNTQYLAMEATRLDDEQVEASGGGEALDDMMFSGEAPASDAAIDNLALATAHAEDAPPQPTPAEEIAIAATPTGDTQVPVSVDGATPDVEGEAAPTAFLVAVDANLSTLEWLKNTVDGLFQHVHIFQRREAALDRIRQYLVRGTVPIVMLADATADRSGPDAQRFIARLRGLAPSITVLALRAENALGELPLEVDGAVERPSSPSADPDRWHLHEATAARLRSELAPWLRGGHSVSARRKVRSVLARLKSASERIRDPETHGEVLTLALDFAEETFGRVALFMLRDDLALGMAQRGLPESGGPDDAALRTLTIGPAKRPAIFQRVLDSRTAVRAAPENEADRQLAKLLGGNLPSEAYAAPIESGGEIVAIVYSDNQPGNEPLPDTTPFEIVLHEAGLVLDRALLERALAERS